jgi:hypothetical protein
MFHSTNSVQHSSSAQVCSHTREQYVNCALLELAVISQEQCACGRTNTCACADLCVCRPHSPIYGCTHACTQEHVSRRIHGHIILTCSCTLIHNHYSCKWSCITRAMPKLNGHHIPTRRSVRAFRRLLPARPLFLFLIFLSARRHCKDHERARTLQGPCTTIETMRLNIKDVYMPVHIMKRVRKHTLATAL